MVGKCQCIKPCWHSVKSKLVFFGKFLNDFSVSDTYMKFRITIKLNFTCRSWWQSFHWWDSGTFPIIPCLPAKPWVLVYLLVDNQIRPYFRIQRTVHVQLKKSIVISIGKFRKSFYIGSGVFYLNSRPRLEPKCIFRSWRGTAPKFSGPWQVL